MKTSKTSKALYSWTWQELLWRQRMLTTVYMKNRKWWSHSWIMWPTVHVKCCWNRQKRLDWPRKKRTDVGLVTPYRRWSWAMGRHKWNLQRETEGWESPEKGFGFGFRAGGHGQWPASAADRGRSAQSRGEPLIPLCQERSLFHYYTAAGGHSREQPGSKSPLLASGAWSCTALLPRPLSQQWRPLWPPPASLPPLQSPPQGLSYLPLSLFSFCCWYCGVISTHRRQYSCIIGLCWCMVKEK